MAIGVVLHAIDNNPPMLRVPPDVIKAVDNARETWWSLKDEYPEYANGYDISRT